MDIATSTSPGPSSAVAVDEIVTFSDVTEGLLNIGAVTTIQYLSLPTPAPPVQQSYPVAPPVGGVHIATKGPIGRLHQACQHTFGNASALRFTYEEVPEQGAFAVSYMRHLCVPPRYSGKRCLLTITRPNGETRTYASPTFHMKKYDAKTSVATHAVQNGALDFILSGESSAAATHSVSTPVPEAVNTPLDMDESVKAIEQCCLEWSGGKIKPFWLHINEPKFGRSESARIRASLHLIIHNHKAFGCALRISVGSNNSRVYSVNTVYKSPGEARKACADAAIADGVIDYIKTWHAAAVDQPPDETEPPSSTTLQEFFDSLPQPFPEPVAGKTAADINGPAWLNTTIQAARGCKLVPNFIWTVNPQLGRRCFSLITVCTLTHVLRSSRLLATARAPKRSQVLPR